MNIDKKSLIVGLLLGVLLCLLLQFIPQAQAQVARQPVPRYQITGGGGSYGVIDSFTGDIYELRKMAPRQHVWKLLRKGPPR